MKYVHSVEGKVKLYAVTTHITVKIITILGAIAVVILFFFSLIFAIASYSNPLRLVTSLMLFIVGSAIAAITYYTTRKPKTIIQQ